MSGTAAGNAAMFVFVCLLFSIGTKQFEVPRAKVDSVFMRVLAKHPQWQMYPIELKRGSYEIVTHGTWGVMEGQDCGPDGAPSHATGNEKSPMPGAAVGSLIGVIVPSKSVDLKQGTKVPDDAKQLAVGHSIQFSVTEPSRMFFLINDGDWPGKIGPSDNTQSGYTNNEGAICVSIIPI
jgi:hypothetical protein